MSIASEITRINTNIANSYTAVDNKNGTLPQVQNSANLASAIDSIEVIEQATAEGESLSLTNTKAMPYSDYVVEGKSEQATRSGKNAIIDEYDSASSYITWNLDKSKVQSSMIFSGIFSKSNNSTIYFQTSGGIIVGGSISVTANQKVQLTITLSNDDLNKILTSTYTPRIKIYGGDYSDIEYSEVMYRKTNTDDTYEPYGASPNPDYPSEIHSVADDVNLFDINSTVGGNANFTKTIENNHLTLTATGTIGAQFIGNYVKNVDSSKKYTLSFKAKKTVKGTDGEPVIEIIVYGSNDDTNYTLVELSRQNPVEGQEYSFNKTVTGYNYYRFFIYNNASTPVTVGEKTEYWDIKFQEGSIATPYSPYNQGTVTIKQRGTTENNDYTIQTEPLRSLPNGVKDTIEADGIHRRVGRVVLDGSENENWALSGTSTTGYYRFSSAIINNIVEKPSSNSQVVDILSNNYMKKSADNTYSLQTGICIATNGAIIIYDDNLKQYTVENFKTWLSTHNVEVLYELANEVIEPLTQNQATTMLDIIKTGSYEGTTNIYTDEDVKPTIGVGYYKKG